MNDYPEAVATIVRDYLDRVGVQLRAVPAAERDEFLRELESHIYEGYHQRPEQEPVARILAILRNLGEPAEVVADRLPEAMVRSGASRNIPLRILTGALIALFGVPLGIGGVAVVGGILVAIAAMLFAYYVATGAIVLTGVASAFLGVSRMYNTDFGNMVMASGLIRMEGPVGEYLRELAPGNQGLLLLLCGAVLMVAGVGLLWLGKHMVRGTRFLFTLTFDGLRRGAQRLRGHSNAPAPARSRVGAPVRSV